MSLRSVPRPGGLTGRCLGVLLVRCLSCTLPLFVLCLSMLLLWDSAPLTAKLRLDTVQRVALRVATGATFSSGTDALLVYCNIWPLQLRRTVSAFQRVVRLGVRHPIFRLVRDWRTCGSRTTRHSIFCRAFAVLRRIRGLTWVEHFPPVEGGFPPLSPSCINVGSTFCFLSPLSAIFPACCAFSRSFRVLPHDFYLH